MAHSEKSVASMNELSALRIRSYINYYIYMHVNK